MGVLKKLAFLFTLGSVTFAIRWHYIGRLYRTRRNFANCELIVITGATSGIGLAVVRELVSRGCHLVLGCRDKAASVKVRKDLKKQFGTDIKADIFYLDLCCLNSVAAFVDKVNGLEKPIYALVNNAGIFYAPPATTVDGLEQTFQVNFLSHYLITLLLLPKLKLFPGNSRVINVSSKAHQAVERIPDLELHRKFEDLPSNRFRAYQYSKFCLVLFAHKLSSILADSSVSIHCVDPGNVETDIYRHFPPLANKALFYLQKPLRLIFIKTSREGAQGILYAILSEKIPNFYITKFGSNGGLNYQVNRHIYNPILGDTLWTLSRQLCHGHLLEMS